jgi:hypothetical protein
MQDKVVPDENPPLSMANLMFRIEQHICVEEDGMQLQRLQDNSIVVPKKPIRDNTTRGPRKSKQPEPVRKESFEAVNTTFKEPIFRILPQIKDKPYFVWPPKMGGDPASRESKPYYAYHKEKGHLIENCRAYKGFLEVLVRNGHFRQFVDDIKPKQQWDNSSKPKDPIRIIEVIHSHTKAADLRAEVRAAAHLQEVFQVCEDASPAPKRLRKETTKEITFTNHDLEGV